MKFWASSLYAVGQMDTKQHLAIRKPHSDLVQMQSALSVTSHHQYYINDAQNVLKTYCNIMKYVRTPNQTLLTLQYKISILFVTNFGQMLSRHVLITMTFLY